MSQRTMVETTHRTCTITDMSNASTAICPTNTRVWLGGSNVGLIVQNGSGTFSAYVRTGSTWNGPSAQDLATKAEARSFIVENAR